MVAYNFHKQFIEPIRNGSKCQTIRRTGKRRHARPGEKLQLYGIDEMHLYWRKVRPDTDSFDGKLIQWTFQESA